MKQQHLSAAVCKLGALIMNATLAALLTGSLISCTTMGVFADDGRRTSNGNGPLTRGSSAGGNNSNNNSNNNHNGNGSGDRNHGFHGERWQDNVPRTPMWLVNTFTGQRNSPVHPESNARGIANWWRGDRAVDELINRIQIGYDYGARWFFVNRPMGTPGNAHVPGASWLTLEDEKRDELPDKLADALFDRFDEPVHVVWFIGSDMSDPRTFNGWTEGQADQFHGVGEQNTWEELLGTRMTLGGWISTGASGIAIDHSALIGERSHFIRLAEALGQFPFNINVYGEAYPFSMDNGRLQRGQGGAPILCDESIRKMPWIAINQFVDTRWPEGNAHDCFPLDTDETRLFVWINQSAMRIGNEDERERYVNGLMDMGLIPITEDPVMFTESLQRLGSGANAQNSTSRSSGNDNGSGGNTSRVIIRPSAARRSATTSRTSVPDQELPERYKNRGTGVR